MHPHDTEALPGWGFHHDPTLEAVDDLRAQPAQACHLGRNVVSFDVYVDPTFMFDSLNLHNGLIGLRGQHPIVAPAAGMLQVHGTAQGLSPEIRGRIDVSRLAVDQHGTKSRRMHRGILVCALVAFFDPRGGIARPVEEVLVLEGTVSKGGLEGHFTRTIEPGSGKSVENRDYGVIQTGSGNDGRRAWSRDVSGFSHDLNSEFAQRLARSEAWLSAHQGERHFSGGKIVPRGGAPIEVWYDGLTGSLDRAMLQYAENSLVRHYADWRDIGSGFRVPFRQVEEDIEDQSTTTFVVEKASLQRERGPDRFRKDAPPADIRFLEPGKPSTVAYEDDHRTRIYIPVYLNGKGPFTFELDSGGHFILAPQTVLALGLAPQGMFSSTGAGTQVSRAGYVRVDSVRIGTAEFVGQPAKVLPLSDASNNRGPKPPRAGILGLELFERFRVSIDRVARTVTLEAPGKTQPPRPWVSVSITFDEDAPLASGSFSGAAGPLMIDTGNAGSSIIEQYWAEQAGRAGVFDTALTVGNETKVALGDITLGPYPLTHEIVSYYGAQPRGSEHTRSVAAVLSEPLLSRFDLIFDYADGLLWLKPLLDRSPVPFNRSGLSPAKTPDGAFSAANVIAGSPADDAGMKVGDLIDEVGGQPSQSLSRADVMAIFQQPAGTVVEVRVRSTAAESARSLSIRLRDAL